MSEQNKPIWELVGIDCNQWRKLSWRVMRKHLYRHGRMSFWRYYFPTPFKIALKIRLWWNEPRGGYLFAAWCKERAERFTIRQNCPNAYLGEEDKYYR